MTKYFLAIIILLSGGLASSSTSVHLDQREIATEKRGMEMTSLQDTLREAEAYPKPVPVMRPEDGKKVNRARITAAVAATLCLASGAAAHYYMSRATDTYNRYLHAGNPRDMNRYYSKTATLDLKTGYSLAVFEISFFVGLISFIQSWEE